MTRIEELERAMDGALKKIGEQAEDIEFLAKRCGGCGVFSLCPNLGRDTGASSNSIVAIAYGLLPLDQQCMPGDAGDYAACLRACEKMPRHRMTRDVEEALYRAGRAVARN